MSRVYIFCFLLFILFGSCQNQQKQDSASQIASIDVTSLKAEFNEIRLTNAFDTIDFNNLPRLTKAEYDSLQLVKVVGLEGYDPAYLSMGRVLFNNERGKIITIQVITDGEVTEYLLSYDKDGNLQDNLLVAYEDMVEYYSQISSRIDSGKIAIQTITYTYSDNENESTETSDTSIVKYKITPQFKFIQD